MKFLLQLFNFFKAWKYVFWLKKIYKKKKNSFAFFLTNFSKFYLLLFRINFSKAKTFLISSLKKTYKVLTSTSIFYLIYLELYFIMQLGTFSIPVLNSFVFARFLCFFKNFPNYNLQVFSLSPSFQLVQNFSLNSNLVLQAFSNKFFLLSFFKQQKRNRMFFAKNFNRTLGFISHLQSFLFNAVAGFKTLKSSMNSLANFFKKLFLYSLKILLIKLKRIMRSYRYTGVSRVNVIERKANFEKKEQLLLYFNKKFKRARKLYFLNYASNVSLFNFKGSKSNLNFLKIFSSSTQIY